MNKKRVIRVSAVAVIVILVLIPIIRKLDLFGGENGADAAQAQRSAPVPVEVAVVVPTSMEERIESAGTVKPNEQVIITSESSGKVLKIYFEEGTRVNKGQLLVKINDSELQAQQQRLRHQVKLAENRERRQQQLLNIEAVSQEEYERALTELNTLRSEVDLIQAQIAKTEIRAPFGGIIGLRYVSEGSYIAPNTNIAELIDNEPVKIDFSVPEKYAGQIAKGDKIRFTIEKTNENYIGYVTAVQPRINTDTRSLTVRAEYGNTNNEVMPGSFAKVVVVLSSADSTLLVPTESIIPELNAQKVFIYKNGTVEPRQVETGQRSNRQIQVTSGLQPYDTVISSGILKVRPGMPVEVIKVTESRNLELL